MTKNTFDRSALARKITDAIFAEFQCGMGTTNHPVAISPSARDALSRLIERTIETDDTERDAVAFR